MSARTSPTELVADAHATLRQLLVDMGLTVTENDNRLAMTTPDGDEIALETIAATVVDERRARELTADRGDVTRVVVADLIGAGARTVLSDAGVGWLDRRGHLHIRRPGVWIDRDVGPVPRHHRNRGPVAAIRGRAAMAVAAANLIDPDAYGGVRPLARRLGLSPSAVSQARAPLADRGLLADAPDARRELFWALAAAWQPEWLDLAAVPDPQPGLVAGGTLAAAALGAPIIATDDYPLELHCADGPLLQRLRLRNDGGPTATTLATPARVSVAPTMLVHEIPGPTAEPGDTADTVDAPTVAGHPIAHPLFVALDLAADPARGAEALIEWEPRGWRRAW